MLLLYSAKAAIPLYQPKPMLEWDFKTVLDDGERYTPDIIKGTKLYFGMKHNSVFKGPKTIRAGLIFEGNEISIAASSSDTVLKD